MSTTESVTMVPAGTWKLDPVHSSVGFEVDYLAGTFKGRFREVEARLAVGDETATLEGAARVESVDVNDENLTAHLQSPDFFDAERFPELRFSADEISLDRDTVTVQGEITIKGVTRPVALAGTVAPPIADPYGNERVGLRVAATIDRTDFGVNWNMPLPTGQPALADDVTIVGELQFVKKA